MGALDIVEDVTSNEEERSEMLIDLLKLPLAYHEKRHREKICAGEIVTQTWRMKERMKTVSVALVLCLNVGVDPPDVVKTSPCARKECWIDPLLQSPQKALESIGNTIQKQYERWQPRARYRQSLDPTVDDVKRLCTSLRRNAKDERVLFHYNGHGVPRPTTNGEIWVFNKSYTQYIPLSLYDLQSWMGSPSIFVYDCSSAGIIVSSFESFAEQREQDMQLNSVGPPSMSGCSVKNCIQLAACSANQILPMNPELPADLFTSCLTTPIKSALQWFCHQRQGSLAPEVTLELIEKIPGRLNDRRTPLGELNWIFTAITDTIAWNTLPRELFQKLFRQDLLVASLFRNFLLAERIMRSYRCTPVSSPRLPTTFRHPMWASWDHAIDVCLSQLSRSLTDDAPATFQNSPFFEQHLTAFEVWLSFGVEHRDPPEQLPIVLQVLLSQVHRLRALELLGRFLDLGPWAVSLALSVGIFPYVLKLLQSQAKELRPLLVFIWAKILAVDGTCQGDIVKDGGHQYFLRALQDPQMPSSHRTMAAFILAEIVNGNLAGQEACLQRNIVSICIDQIDESAPPKLKQWVAICLGRVWTNYDDARWRGVRDQAHERLYELLQDPHPEVRAAAVYALGTFVDNHPTSVSDHAASVNQAVGATLSLLPRKEASVLVRCELTSALQRLVSCYDSSFAAIAFRFVEEERNLDNTKQSNNKRTEAQQVKGYRPSFDLPANYSAMMRQGSGDNYGRPVTPAINLPQVDSQLSSERLHRLRKISLSSLPSVTGSSYSSVNEGIWKVLLSLATDPHPDVASSARVVVAGVMERVLLMTREQNSRYCSEVGSPRGRESESERLPVSESPSRNGSLLPIQLTPYSRTRKSFWKGPDRNSEPFRASEVVNTSNLLLHEKHVDTQFCEWSAHSFAQPSSLNLHVSEVAAHTVEREVCDWLKLRESEEYHLQLDTPRLSDQQFFNKNPKRPVSMIFHPVNNSLVVADAAGLNVWEWETGHRKHSFFNGNPASASVSSLELLNEHVDPLLMVGTDDGCVRVWANCCSEKEVELLSAWQAVTDTVQSTRTSGLVSSWDQSCRKLYTGGDCRYVQVWDLGRERRVQELPTGADSCVTCLARRDGMLAASCGDGTVRLFDTREQYSDRRISHQAHEAWIIRVSFVKSQILLTASEGGDIKLWDVRKISVEPLTTVRNQRGAGGLRQLSVHPNLPIIACASTDHSLNFMGIDGQDLGCVRYYDGFLGQRIGVVTCMAFHPLKANLAVGTADCYLTVYSAQSKHQ